MIFFNGLKSIIIKDFGIAPSRTGWTVVKENPPLPGFNPGSRIIQVNWFLLLPAIWFT
jgi:hypothetical protein